MMVHLPRRRTVQYGAPQRHSFAKCPVSVLLLSTPALYTTVYSAVEDLDATWAVGISLLYLDGTPALTLMAAKGEEGSP